MYTPANPASAIRYSRRLSIWPGVHLERVRLRMGYPETERNAFDCDGVRRRGDFAKLSEAEQSTAAPQ